MGHSIRPAVGDAPAGDLIPQGEKLLFFPGSRAEVQKRCNAAVHDSSGVRT